MPHLEKLIRRGVMGNLATLHPILSPMLWTSIATGKRADLHGILGFMEPRPDGKGIRPVTSGSRKCKAIWNILSDRGMRCSAVGWFASHPAESVNGVVVSNLVEHGQAKDFEHWTLGEGVVAPVSMREVIGDLRVHPSEISNDQLLSIVPGAAKVNQDEDRRLATVARLLSQVSTIHAIGTYLAEHETWDLLAVYYDSIDHFGHGFMQYRRPRMAHVTEEDCEIYGDVVDHCYRLHDLMLGRYMRLVGPDTTILIVSDHGFQIGGLRPPGRTVVEGEGLVHWHRDYGMFLASGPGVKIDKRVYGATLLDITPTILALLGLPAARDMAGRPLMPIFSGPVESESIDTYETPADPSGPVEEKQDPWEAEAMLRQLVDLGYVEEPDEDAAKAVTRAKAQRLANLAQVHLSSRNYAKAAELIEESMKLQVFPSAKLRLAVCRVRLGQKDEARRLVDEVLAEKNETPYARLLHGYLLYLEGRDEEALAALKAVESADADTPQLFEYLGLIYLRQKRWTDAETAFRRSLDIDGDHAHSFHGLGLALLQQNRCEDAVEQLMRSVSLLHHQPRAHLHLGVALAAVGQLDWAIRAFHTALDICPDLGLAHERLAEVYRARGDAATSELHRKLAMRMAESAIGSSLDTPPDVT